MASWILTAYSLTIASFQPLYGKLSDIFGRKECLLAAYTLFAFGSLACGLAGSIEQLIAARVLQAIGGGGLSTVISVLLTGLVPAKDRGVWQGVVSFVYSVGAGLGAPLGGLVASQIGWRWSFFGQVPICMLAITLVLVCLPGDVGRTADSKDHEHLMFKLRRVDFLGAISLIIMIASFMYGLDRGSNVSWMLPATYISFAVSGVTAAWFLYVETRVAKEPIVPFAITFSAEMLPIYLWSFLCFFGIIAMDFLLPLYYQVKGGLNPQQASLYLLPAIILGVLAALLTGIWMRHSGQYYWAILISSVLAIVGGFFAFLLSGASRELMPYLIIAQVLVELAISMAVVCGLIAVISSASDKSVAILTAAFYSFRTLGSVLGVSVISTVIQESLRSTLTLALQGFDIDVEEMVEEVRQSLDSIRDLDPEIAAIVRDCYGKAMNKGFLVILVAFSIAIIPALTVRGGKKARKA